MIGSIRRLRKLVLLALVAALAAALALSACGGDDEPSESAAPQAQATDTTDTTATDTTDVNPETETLPNDGDGNGVDGATSPEDQQGGAGDEVPARSLALFTGKDGVITPRMVQVPAFISVRVELRSGDGAEYSLEFNGKSLKVTDPLHSVATTFDGLRPGAKLVGTVGGTGEKVVVSATAEPGP
jgi:hypothetical protein